jgi:hypothetical protein
MLKNGTNEKRRYEKMRTKFVVRYKRTFGSSCNTTEETETFYLIQKITNVTGNIDKEYYWLNDVDIISNKSFTSETAARQDIFEKYNNNVLISMGFYQEEN